MDTFTYQSYEPECKLLQLSPESWQKEIEGFRPHMLFVESAWEGKDGKWFRKIAIPSTEYLALCKYCKEHMIPIVFWNKEDPVYTNQFLGAAKEADVVFTTDVDCISFYKQQLEHEQVYHLHFAAQPKTHNPIEKFTRKSKACFAGSYYHRYTERSKVFEQFVNVILKKDGIDIYDRHYKDGMEQFKFPEKYEPYILGKLPYNDIDKAYKGYKYCLSMNSVTQSQTMFGRGIFSLLACNTPVISNYSRGVKNYFGDLVISTDDIATMSKELRKYCSEESQESQYKRFRLQGLRRVLEEHLYEDRLGYIVEKVFHKNIKSKLPIIYILAYPDSALEQMSIIAMYQKQSYNNTKLYLINGIEQESIPENIVMIKKNSEKTNVADVIAEDGYITRFEGKDYYGQNYLLDLVLQLRYGEFSGVGKGESAYTICDKLKLRSAIIKKSLVREFTLTEFKEKEYIEGKNLLAADEFNYCKDYIGLTCDAVDDIVIHDQGIHLCSILKVAGSDRENEKAAKIYMLHAAKLIELCSDTKQRDYGITLHKNAFILKSGLREGQHDYIFFKGRYRVMEYNKAGMLKIKFNCEATCSLNGVCVFYDMHGNKISPVFTNLDHMIECKVPDKAYTFEIGIRIMNSGTGSVNNIVIFNRNNSLWNTKNIVRDQVLLLTNYYPSATDLYRNGFIHRRVLGYKENGKVIDVMQVGNFNENTKKFRAYQGINITMGSYQALDMLLASRRIHTLCVHFMDWSMWRIIKKYTSFLKVIIWLHGADVQPWWRRPFLYETAEEMERGKVSSNYRMALWREIFQYSKQYNIQFVMVSNYIKEEIEEDYKVVFESGKNYTIPNFIDSKLFTYVPKSIEHRKKILSIRSFTTKTYANDLLVQAILALKDKPFFSELEFRIAGRGALFEKTVEPLRKYSNITLENRYFSHEQIAVLHRQYGIFLAPSRMDTQGVSRDEAMSSGLVPITSRVAAIPEFVDDTCGILAESEDYMGLADGIEKLYYDEKLFMEMSKNAAKRVRQQSSEEKTILKEIKIING